MLKYLKHNIVPICMECILIVWLIMYPEYFLYINFFFYLGIVIYFVICKDFSIKEMKENICSGKTFWIKVILTASTLALSFAITGIIKMLLPTINDGMGILKVHNRFEVLIFAMSTIILPPLAEELFFRKSLLSFEHKKQMPILMILSGLLFAFEHSLVPFGILIALIWSIPLMVSYIMTKNVYVVIAAHFLCNFVMNGLDVISLFLKLN
jgi:membrane protease YdiL (CAAX protease family)